MPHPGRSVVGLRVGLGVSVTAPEETFFAVPRLFLPVRHFLPLPFWESALAAAVLEAALVRPSLKTLLAALAALLLVCLLLAAISVSLYRSKRRSDRWRSVRVTGCYTGPNPCSVWGISRKDIHTHTNHILQALDEPCVRTRLFGCPLSLLASTSGSPARGAFVLQACK